MLCLSGFELYSRWVPLIFVLNESASYITADFPASYQNRMSNYMRCTWHWNTQLGNVHLTDISCLRIYALLTKFVLKKEKKNEGEQNQATLTEQVWSIRDGKKGQKRNFSCVTNARNPEREKWIHLSHSSRRSERQIRFIFSHIINFVTTCKRFINRRLEEGQVSKKLADWMT